MAAEDHLSLANQQVSGVKDMLVLIRTQEVPLIHFLHTHQEMTETSEEELAAVYPVGVTLSFTFYRNTYTEQHEITFLCTGVKVVLKIF